MGTCELCGGEFPTDELHYGPDPYASEICDDFTETVLCETCYSNRCDDI